MSISNKVFEINRVRRLGLDRTSVMKIAKSLEREGMTGSETFFEGKVVAKATPITAGPVKRNIVGSNPKVAHGYKCKRCGNGQLLAVTVKTASSNLPYCPNCRIVVVPES